MNQTAPIAVYTMGKVGSKTIQDSLGSMNLNRQVFHVHFLSWEGIKEAEEFYLNLPIPREHEYLNMSKRIRGFLEETRRQVRWKVITLMRDPIARDISDLFENMDDVLPIHGLNDEEAYRKIINYLDDLFLNYNEADDYACNWFDKEIKRVFNLDLFAQPFDKEKGYQIYQAPDADILAIQLEKLTDCHQEAFEKFLGIQNFNLVRSNTGEQKSTQHLYKRVQKHFRLSPEIINPIYQTRYAQQFYTDEQINKFKQKWIQSDLPPVQTPPAPSTAQRLSFQPKRKVMFIHPEGNLHDNNNLAGMIQLLSENNYQVDYYCPRRADILQYAPYTGVNITYVDGVNRDTIVNSTLALQDSYDLVIGVDKGIIPAARIAQQHNLPLGYISYEIFFADETSPQFKQPEIEACRQISFAVCQDATRSQQLSVENHIPIEKIIQIPVAGRGIIAGERTYLLHDRLGLDRNLKLALYIGSINYAWSMTGELINSTPAWHDNWRLILHNRYGNNPQWVQSFRQQFPHSDKVLFSPLGALHSDDMHQLLHAADLGIGFYKPVYQDPHDGKNLLHIGMASGKISTYLQHGLPIMVNQLGELSDHVRNYKLGVVIEKPEQIPQALSRFAAMPFSLCRNNCFQFFENQLDLNKTIKPLLETIKSTLQNRPNVISTTMPVQPSAPSQTSAEESIKQSEELMKSGDFDTASQILNQAIAYNPDDVSLIIAKGNLLINQQDIEGARREFVKATFFDPNNHLAHSMLGLVLIYQKQYKEAKESLTRALEIKPYDENVRTMLQGIEKTGVETDMEIHTPPSANSYLISVIVSTYASEEFIEECLTDLVNQTINDKLEIIVVDANSPQNERAIVERFQAQHPNIHYIRTSERITIYAAWNVAIQNASGKYIAPFSTNDRLRKDAYEIMSNYLENHPDVDLVYGDTYITHTPHETFENHTRTSVMLWPDFSYEDLIENSRVGPHPMWRKSANDELGGFDEQYRAAGDQEFWLRMAAAGKKLAHLKMFTGLYWATLESLSGAPDIVDPEVEKIHSLYRQQYQGNILQRWEQAREHVNQAVEHYVARNLNAALLESQQALNIAPDISDTQIAYAQFLVKHEKVEQAIQHLRNGIDLSPNRWDARMLLANLLAITGNPDEASHEFDELVSLTPLIPMVAPQHRIVFGVVDLPSEEIEVSQKLSLDGWVLTKHGGAPTISVFVDNQAYPVKVNRIPRPDLAIRFSEITIKNIFPGFTVTLDTSQLPTGKHTFTCLAEYDDQNMIVGQTEFKVTNAIAQPQTQPFPTSQPGQTMPKITPDWNKLPAISIPQNRQLITSAIVAFKQEDQYLLQNNLENLIHQTFFQKGHLQIIAVVRNSYASGIDYINQLQARYPNIEILQFSENKNNSDAWNTAVHSARGKYITIIEPSDCYRFDGIEQITNKLEEQPTFALAYSDVALTRQNDEVFEQAHIYGYHRWPAFDARRLFQVAFPGSHVIWKRELHDRYGFFDTTLKTTAQYEFWLRLAKTEHLFHIREVLGLHFIPRSETQDDSYEAEAETVRQRHWPSEWGPRPPAMQPDTYFETAGAMREVTTKSTLSAVSPQENITLNTHLKQADEFFSQGNFNEARAALEKALNIVPNDTEIIIALGNIMLRQGDVDSARREFLKATHIAPNHTAALINLAAVYFMQNSMDDAQNTINRVLSFEPGNLESKKLLANIYLSKSQYQDSLTLLNEIENFTPEDVEVLLASGKCNFELGNLNEAAIKYNRVLSITPNHKIAQDNLTLISTKRQQSSPAAPAPIIDQSPPTNTPLPRRLSFSQPAPTPPAPQPPPVTPPTSIPPTTPPPQKSAMKILAADHYTSRLPVPGVKENEHLTLLLHIDGFRPDYIEHTPFIKSMAKESITAKVFQNLNFIPLANGFNPINNTSHKHGTSPFLFTPQQSPFSIASAFPHKLPSSYQKEINQEITSFLRKERRITDFAFRQLTDYHIPPIYLPFFTPTISRYPWNDPAKTDTFFANLIKSSQKWYCNTGSKATSPLKLNDETVIEQTIQALNINTRFAYIQLSDIRTKGTQYGPNANETQQTLQNTDNLVKNLIDTLDSLYEKVDIILWSNHGMLEIKNSFDMHTLLKEIGLDYGKDFAYFLEPTLARFWFINPKAEKEIRSLLNKNTNGRILNKADMKRLSLTECPASNGDMIFITEPGTVIFPNFKYEEELPKGAYGYTTKDNSNFGFMLLRSQDPIKISSTSKPVLFDEIFDILNQLVNEQKNQVQAQ